MNSRRCSNLLYQNSGNTRSKRRLNVQVVAALLTNSRAHEDAMELDHATAQ